MINGALVTEQTVLSEVQQAEIVLSARLGISVTEAGRVLRTIAYCAGTPLLAVARYVLAGRNSVN